MSNELMIPEASAVPAFLRNPELAKAANEEAAAGISTGFPARVKLSGKQWMLVDGNGEEKPFPPAKLFAAPDDNVYFPMVVLRAKKALSKAWYLKKYNPNAEVTQAPDCFSNDGERPDATSPSPQSETCASCPHNAFGSGTDQDGNATKGKACSDAKILAVFVPGFGVHSFKLPPASLKNFGLYVKQLSAAGIPLTTVKTLVGFDLTQTYPILVFQYGGFIGQGQDEAKQRSMIEAFAKMAQSVEVEDIVNPVAVPVTRQISAPAPGGSGDALPPSHPYPGDPIHDDGSAEEEAEAARKAAAAAEAEKTAKAEAAAKKKAAAAAKKAKEDAATAAKPTVAAGLDADFDMDLGGATEKETASTGPSDEDLMRELGL